MSVSVQIPSQLRPLTEGRAEVDADGSTVAGVIDDLDKRYPGVANRLLSSPDELRRFVNLYVDEEDVRFLQGLTTTVPDGARISIIPSVAGGS